jgi:hypothetical protein
MKNKLNVASIVIALAVLLSIVSAVNLSAQAILQEVPEKIDAKAMYLFYLHGRIIEEQGIRPTSEKYGVYEYQEILEALKDKGFIVISEARKKRTPVGGYAQTVSLQISDLLKAGVPPSHITVVGASKGAIIAMQVSTMLGNKEINFVFMAGCSDYVYHRFDTDFHGNILSIYDEKDELAGSCKMFVEKSTGINKYKEIKLTVGTGHGILYKPLKEWIDPVTKWAKGEM